MSDLNQCHGVVVGRSTAREARLLAHAAHHHVGAHRGPRPRARSERRGARAVVGAARVPGPTAALIAKGGDERLRGLVAPAGIAGASVVLGVDGFGVDDRALLPQLGDERVIPSREVDVIPCVGAGRRPHVHRVERILERERDAVHRQPRKIRRPAVLRVKLRRALEGVGLPAELLADGRGSRRQRARRRDPVAVSLARHRALAAQIERAKRVDLAGVRRADRHAVLLLHGRIRRGRLHPAELDRRPGVLIEIGHERRDGHRLGGELQRRPRAHRTGRGRDRRAVARD